MRRLLLRLAINLALIMLNVAPAKTSERVVIDGFAIDRTEITVCRFRQFARERRLTTAAERDGGGYEFAGGWTRSKGWFWSEPFGEPAADNEPAVHVSWNEARDYCIGAGGRLPTFDEWRKAAYTETQANPADGFVTARTYLYPVGDTPDGMNTSDRDQWPRHSAVGVTKRGVNGLYDMGGNVWEWLADRRGGEALTAGGSWWYGPDKAQATAAQWKAADFYAVYVGFRCAYNIRN